MDKKKERTSFWIAVQGIKKWVFQPRVYVVLFAIFIFSWTKIEGVKSYAIEQGLGVSCWFFPMLFGDYMCAMFLYFGLILMYCNAPFIDQQQLFVILRSGKRKWFFGQILYIVFTSILYFLTVVMVSILEFIPYVGISADWGTVLHEVLRDPKGTKTYLYMPEKVLEMYEPIKAFFLIFCINVGIGIMLGLLIFLINLHKSRTYGSIAAFGLVFLSDLISYAGDYKDWLQYISPITWTDLSVYSRNVGSISYGYVFSFLIIASVILVVLIIRRSKHYNIEAAEEI